jgi:putative transposase
MCGLFRVYTSTFYYRGHPRDDRDLRIRIKEIAASRPRYGCPRIYVILRREGYLVNHKRVRRIYREEGLFLRTKSIRRRKHGAILRVPPPKPTRIISSGSAKALDFEKFLGEFPKLISDFLSQRQAASYRP